MAAVANWFGRSALSQPCVCLCLVGLSTAAYIPTLLHGPECNLGDWHGVPSSCAPLGGFAIGTLVSLLGQHIWTKCQRVLVLTLCLFVSSSVWERDVGDALRACRHIRLYLLILLAGSVLSLRWNFAISTMESTERPYVTHTTHAFNPESKQDLTVNTRFVWHNVWAVSTRTSKRHGRINVAWFTTALALPSTHTYAVVCSLWPPADCPQTRQLSSKLCIVGRLYEIGNCYKFSQQCNKFAGMLQVTVVASWLYVRPDVSRCVFTGCTCVTTQLCCRTRQFASTSKSTPLALVQLLTTLTASM